MTTAISALDLVRPRAVRCPQATLPAVFGFASGWLRGRASGEALLAAAVVVARGVVVADVMGAWADHGNDGRVNRARRAVAAARVAICAVVADVLGARAHHGNDCRVNRARRAVTAARVAMCAMEADVLKGRADQGGNDGRVNRARRAVASGGVAIFAAVADFVHARAGRLGSPRLAGSEVVPVDPPASWVCSALAFRAVIACCTTPQTTWLRCFQFEIGCVRRRRDGGDNCCEKNRVHSEKKIP